MIKKTLLTLILAATVGAAFAQPVKDTVSIGAGYANQVWYSLDNDELKTSPKNEWDLAFELKNITSSIHINSANGIMLWNYPKADASGWSGTIDTTDKSTWTARYNSDTSWALGAMGRYTNPSDPTDLDWGKYNMSTHVVTGDSIYIVKLANGNYRKLMIESLASGTYTFKYADLDGSNPKSGTIVKTNFTGKAFAYYSLQNNATLAASREPDADKWDMLFTQYTTFIPIAYGVTGVLHNRDLEAVKVNNLADKDTYKNWMAHTFSSAINTIGYNWKSFNGSSYDVADSTVYFVKSVSGDIWKLIFTGFGSSADGKMAFTKEKIGGTSITDADNQPAATLVLYPNPSNGQDVTVVYDINTTMIDVVLTVNDITGKMVYNTRLENGKGMHQHRLPSQTFNPGVYIISVATDAGRTQQKLIVR